MKCIQLNELGYLSNSYILFDESTYEAAIIDPSQPVENYSSLINEFHLTVKYILITHTHFDHIWCYDALSDYYKVTGFCSSEEVLVANEIEYNVSWLINKKFHLTKPIDIIKSSDLLLGSHSISVLATPGHSVGSLSFYCDKKLFSGDLLFQEGIGRWDLPGGDYKQLMESIKRVLSVYPSDTIIYPGHGSNTSLEHEKVFNPYL